MNHSTLYAGIRRLGSSMTVLHVGAHPDDEEIGLLAYTAFKHFGRAVYWSATRGEGGQNMINTYQGDALGVYRTWESLAAREMDGGECLFGSFVDFGFSKSAHETFSRWSRERLTRELVQAIRLVQPRIVVSRWDGSPSDGHGHHQAVGLALYDAFELAADPDAFPDLADRGYAPWRAEKLYASLNKTIYPSGQKDHRYEKPGFAGINTGEYSPFLGCTYQEQAWKAYLRHRCQGIRVLPEPGDFYYYFRSVFDESGAPVGGRNLFSGLDPGLAESVRGVEHVPHAVVHALRAASESVEKALSCLDPEDPSEAAPFLMQGLDRLGSAIEALETAGIDPMAENALKIGLKRKAAGFEKAVAGCLGLRLEAVCTRGRITPGESVWVRGRLRNYGRANPDSIEFATRLPEGWRIPSHEDEVLQETEDGAFILLEAMAENNADLSRPYWLARPKTGWTYDIPVRETTLLPLAPPLVSMECTVRIGRTAITLSEPALYRAAYDGAVQELPVSLIPPISLHPEFTKKVMLVRDAPRTLSIRVTARCNDEERPAGGRLTVNGPEGWRIEPKTADVRLAPVDGVDSLEFRVTVPANAPEGTHDLAYDIHCRERTYGVVLDPVRMGANETTSSLTAAGAHEAFLLRPATVSLSLVDAKYTDGRRYAHIRGAAEPTAAVLRDLGIPIEEVDAARIAHGDLSVYDTVVVGPNAYLLRSELRENAQCLLEYAASGGTLIVLHQGYGYEARGLAPYSFTYSRPHDRVTDERAEVRRLAPDDPLFHYPNRIQPTDFDGWVRDRGAYFFGQWDDRYQSLLSCADPGEAPQKGGLMKCGYGRGTYVYVGYSLHKQLPAGVAGAFRLFFNLLCTPAKGT